MTRAELEVMVAGCPFHRELGLVLEDFDQSAGRLTLSLTAKEALSRDDTRVELHGGVIATLIDVAGDYAVALKVGQGVPTISLNVDYLRFARGTKVFATATLIKCGRSIAVVDIEVADETGALIAVGRGTYSSAIKSAT